MTPGHAFRFKLIVKKLVNLKSLRCEGIVAIIFYENVQTFYKKSEKVQQF